MTSLREQWQKKMEMLLPERQRVFLKAASFEPVYEEGNIVRFVKKGTKAEPLPETYFEREVSKKNLFVKNFPTIKNRLSFGLLTSALIMLLISTPLMLAFEAHVINVTATVIQIDPPTILPPALQCQDENLITIDVADPDATHIFYTTGPGTDPNTVPDPVCGGPQGGPKPIAPFAINDDTVVKAISCDGGSGTAHQSIVVTKVYDLSCFGKIEGYKYKDVNKNEAYDSNVDFGVEGWKMYLYKSYVIVMTTLTDNVGYYAFNNVPPGEYVVREEDRPDWVHIGANFASTTIASTETQTVNFLNSELTNQCVPQDIIFPISLAVQAAGASSGNDDVAVESNVTIQGSVRTNDELERIGSASVTRSISGNAVITNTLDTGFLISSGIIGSAPTAPLTFVDQLKWKTEAGLGGTVNGSFNFPNGTVGLTLGPTEIMGNVTFGENSVANIKGPLYIHGNLTLGTSTTLTEDAGFGDLFIPIIVDGKVAINPGASFVKSGTKGAFLIVSNSAAIAGEEAAILVRSDTSNSNVGDAVLYAQNGDIHVGGNRTVLAAFAKSGTGADNDPNAAVRIDSGSVVSYRNLPTQISCGPRQPFETSAHVVINEFMPNPGSGKIGTAGGPLDGEWIEIFNPTNGPVDITGYVLYDNDNGHALPITVSNTDTGNLTIPSKERVVVYRDGNPDFNLEVSGGDTVRLISDTIGNGGVLVDSHTYTASVPTDKSFARIPDGTANWIDPEATPGAPNRAFFEEIPELPETVPDATFPTLPQITIMDDGNEEVLVSLPPNNDTPPEPFDVPVIEEEVPVLESDGDEVPNATPSAETPAVGTTTNAEITKTAEETPKDDTSSLPSATPQEIITTPVKTEDPLPPTDMAPAPDPVLPPPEPQSTPAGDVAPSDE